MTFASQAKAYVSLLESGDVTKLGSAHSNDAAFLLDSVDEEL